jgi:MFS family permease
MPTRETENIIPCGAISKSAGLGSSTQHPLASSLMAHAFAGERSMKAIGTYNFAGDIGKMTIPAIASLLLVVLPWRRVLALFGTIANGVANYLGGKTDEDMRRTPVVRVLQNIKSPRFQDHEG